MNVWVKELIYHVYKSNLMFRFWSLVLRRLESTASIEALKNPSMPYQLSRTTDTSSPITMYTRFQSVLKNLIEGTKALTIVSQEDR